MQSEKKLEIREGIEWGWAGSFLTMDLFRRLCSALGVEEFVSYNRQVPGIELLAPLLLMAA